MLGLSCSSAIELMSACGEGSLADLKRMALPTKIRGMETAQYEPSEELKAAFEYMKSTCLQTTSPYTGSMTTTLLSGPQTEHPGFSRG
jgi:hypothetical protein